MLWTTRACSWLAPPSLMSWRKPACPSPLADTIRHPVDICACHDAAAVQSSLPAVLRLSYLPASVAQSIGRKGLQGLTRSSKFGLLVSCR